MVAGKGEEEEDERGYPFRSDSVNYNNDLVQNTGGLTVGDPVLKTGKPLSVELGPGTSFCFLFLDVLIFVRIYVCVAMY